MTTAWSWYVIGLVAFNIVGCIALLWWTSRPRPPGSSPEDTSHVWDGDITEYNKPLPKWWINMFYLTIVYSVGYLFWYGGWGGYDSMSGWSSADELKRTQSVENAKLEAAFAPYAGRPIDALAQDPVAVRLGQSIFSNTCATCHGSTAQGAPGFPNLRDDIWHWGGGADDILTTVREGREGVMPPWGTVLTGMGGDTAIVAMTAYVRSLSNPAQANDYFAAQGERMYQNLCVACHAVDGKGNAALGAPDLTDAYWLYGGSNAQIAESIANGRHGVMPAHGALLGETRARLVSAFVWSLSNPSAPAAGAAELRAAGIDTVPAGPLAGATGGAAPRAASRSPSDIVDTTAATDPAVPAEAVLLAPESPPGPVGTNDTPARNGDGGGNNQPAP